MSQKSYNEKATLYLIPTPIGNIDDITYRAIKVLDKVDYILSEDTRETIKLLNYYNIKKPLISNHEHNEEKNIKKVKELLSKGNSIGLVSDRGTPIINDPGYNIVKYVIDLGYNVVALPGPTAFIPALITSGLQPIPFTFIGFLSNKESKRKNELARLNKNENTMIFYEAPHRIKKTLENMLEIFGNREISISREISKKFEEIYRGRITEVLEELKNVKGEFVIVVEGLYNSDKVFEMTIIEHVNLYIEKGFSSKDAIKIVALERDLQKNYVYNIYHETH